MGSPAAVAALVAALLLGVCAAAAAISSSPLPALMHESFAGKSEFRTVNRKPLQSCLDPRPYLAINVSAGGPLPDEAFINVTVGGVRAPHRDDWVAMITPSNSSVSGCPLNGADYIETGDLARLPLLCHYPVKVNTVPALNQDTQVVLPYEEIRVLFVSKQKKWSTVA